MLWSLFNSSSHQEQLDCSVDELDHKAVILVQNIILIEMREREVKHGRKLLQIRCSVSEIHEGNTFTFRTSESTL